MVAYGKLPVQATLKPKPFTAHIPDEKLSHMKQLIELSPLGPQTYENSQTDGSWGVSYQWMTEAKKRWLNGYDWRKCEDRINGFPNYTTVIKDDEGNEFDIQFLALFSERADAIPIAFYHGWPGSILEFLPMLNVIKSQYSPKELPYHIIVPSLPGYAFSSGPPTCKNMNTGDIAVITNQLMVGLGFGTGYIAQGGDIGSFVTRQSAERFHECKAFHLNFCPVPEPKDADLKVESMEEKALPRGKAFREFGHAYASEHGTRTATIGHVLSASPIALLAWIGEKFIEWTDTTPELDEILDSVTLYWLTETFARCIYPYRVNHGPSKGRGISSLSDMSQNRKPMGFSWFPKELVPVPISWVRSSGNLVHYNRHERGGHFAAMEKPRELWGDVEDFVRVAWKG